MLVSGAIGGTISKLTGGKFASGASSAAFAAALRADWRSKKPIVEGSAEWEAREEAELAKIIAQDQTYVGSGNLLASNWDWLDKNSFEIQFGGDFTLMVAGYGFQIGGYLGGGDDGVSLSLFFAPLENMQRYYSPISSNYIGFGGAGGVAKFKPYSGSSLFSSSTSTSKLITGGAAYGAAGAGYSLSLGGGGDVSFAKARGFGLGIGAYTAEGEQQTWSGRINW